MDEIESAYTDATPKLDPTVITLAALLHDVGDRGI
jgi:HD superfamily phosphodiesterase